MLVLWFSFFQNPLREVLHFFRKQQDPITEGTAYDFSPPTLHPLVFQIFQALEQWQGKGRTALRHSQFSTAYAGGTLGPCFQLPFSICTKKWKKENTDKKYCRKCQWVCQKRWTTTVAWDVEDDFRLETFVLSCLTGDGLHDDLRAPRTWQAKSWHDKQSPLEECLCLVNKIRSGS